VTGQLPNPKQATAFVLFFVRMDYMTKPGTYKHYKGELFEVIGLGQHSETLEELVIYRHAGEPIKDFHDLWARPRDMFEGEVEIDGEMVKRFSLVQE
jgi:hypothetical protein